MTSTASGSSLGKRRSRLAIIVTFDPNRENACPNSHPIGPPPIIAKESGRWVIEKTSSLVI